MKKRQKRAFTLTELLVTVVIIGVLAAVVLPKFNKVMEGMKTGEAERMLTSVRTEQEARCTLGQNYLADGAKVRAFPGNTSKNYTYAFSGSGMSARSKSGTYILQMPSYMDGRICCDGAGCAGLNKDYPTCEALTALPNYQPGTECAAASATPTPTPQGCGEKPTQPEDKLCGCNNTGHQSYTWNEESCEWELDSTCEGENTAPCEIPACVKPAKPEDEPCGCNNTGRKSYTWNEESCQWKLGSTCEGEDTTECDGKKCYGKKFKSLKLEQYEFLGSFGWNAWKTSSTPSVPVVGQEFLRWGGAVAEPRPRQTFQSGGGACANNTFAGYVFPNENCYTDAWEVRVDTPVEFVCGAYQGENIPGLAQQSGVGEDTYWPEDGSNSISCQQCVVVKWNDAYGGAGPYEARVRLTCEYEEDKSISWKCSKDQTCGSSYGTCK